MRSQKSPPFAGWAFVNYFTFGRSRVCESYVANLNGARGMQMRICIDIAFAIGLIWSVAAISKSVLVTSAEIPSIASP
jgi:hypothetical protein